MAIRRKTYKGFSADENEVFVCDTAADLSQLPADAPQGSSAFVIEDSTTYMIDSSGTWTEVHLGNSGGGGGDITLDNLSVTENGVYTPESGHAYKKVTVAVEDIPDPDPADGKTHIWARIDEDTPDDRKGFTLAWSQSVSNGVEVDWGDSGFVVDTLTGPVVSFSGDVSVHSIAVGIEPAQEGSGDPSPDNVRPITGWTGSKVARRGKNLMDPDITGYVKGINYQWKKGVVPQGVAAIMSFRDKDTTVDISDIFVGFSADDLSAQGLPSHYRWSIQNGVITSNCTNISRSDNTTTCGNVVIYPKTDDAFNRIFARYDIQVEIGAEATDYEPYAGDVFDVSFPSEAGTVYGGTLDVTAGTLTVEWYHLNIEEFTAVYDTQRVSSGMVFALRSDGNTFPRGVTSSAQNITIICNRFICHGQVAADGECYVTNNGLTLVFAIPDASVNTLALANAWLANNPTEVVYRLRDPVIYNLTPQQIATLAGTNNVWADTGDTTAEIEFYDVHIQTAAGTGAVSLTHQYEKSGEYEITVDAIKGNVSFTGTSGTAGTSIYGSKANAQCYNRQRIRRISVGANAAVGSYMAHYCYGLSRVGLPSTLTSIGSHAFEECFSLPSVEIPSGVTSIGEYAFSYCHSLESAEIPDSVESIGAYAFRNCYGLREIDFPSGLTSISDYTYQGCYNLTSIDIPDTVTSIGGGAFHSCYGLTSVRIPASVRSIGDSAFLNCYGVSEYHIESTTPPTLASTNAFTGMASDCVIYVPRSANQTVLNAYKAATNWVTYASRMQEEAE